MGFIATITDDAEADAMPLWESPEQASAAAAYDVAEQHIHRAQPDDVIAPVDGWGQYAIWTQNQDGTRSARVATLTVSTADPAPATGRDPRVVGGRYRSYYWSLEYTVNAIAFDPNGWLTSITITDRDGTRAHCTPWDSRDEILFDPRTDKAQP